MDLFFEEFLVGGGGLGLVLSPQLDLDAIAWPQGDTRPASVGSGLEPNESVLVICRTWMISSADPTTTTTKAQPGVELDATLSFSKRNFSPL